MGECLDVIFGKVELLPSNVSHKSSAHNEHRFLCRVSDVPSRREDLEGEYLSVDAELRH